MTCFFKNECDTTAGRHKRYGFLTFNTPEDVRTPSLLTESHTKSGFLEIVLGMHVEVRGQTASEKGLIMCRMDYVCLHWPRLTPVYSGGRISSADVTAHQVSNLRLIRHCKPLRRWTAHGPTHSTAASDWSQCMTPTTWMIHPQPTPLTHQPSLPAEPPARMTRLSMHPLWLPLKQCKMPSHALVFLVSNAELFFASK